MKRELNLQNDRFTLKERLRERLYICAGSALTPVNVLAQLAFDKLDLVRRRVAENPKTPLAILENLAFDADTDVRIAVSENGSTPQGLLLKLACTDCADVRYAIAENSHTPRQILCLLMRDENPYVADRAAKTMEWQQSIEYPRAA